MVIKRLREVVLSLVILPMIIQPVFAHSIWVVKGENAGEFKVLYGHPEKDASDPYDSIKFQDATAYDDRGFTVPLSVKRENEGVTLASPRNVAIIVARHDNGYSVRFGENPSRNVFRPEALRSNAEGAQVTHNYKYAKAFYKPTGLFSQRFGLPLEIVPQQDPLAVGPGGTLQVQVLYQGQPQAGVTVEYEGEVAGITNERGFTSVTLGQGDVHVIESEHRVPSTDDPAADEVTHACSLTIDKTGNTLSNYR